MTIRNGCNILYWIFLFSVLGGCATFEDLRFEGEAETRKLAAQLRSIDTKEELQKSLPKIKKRFNKIANLIVELQKFPVKEKEPSLAAEELFVELARLYEIPGGKELIESAQVEAVHRLRSARVQ